MNYQRENASFRKIKKLVIVFAVVFSALVGVMLPYVVSGGSVPPPLGNSPDKTGGAEEEPGFAYITNFFFNEEQVEIYSDETDLLRFLISERNGVTCFNSITAREVHIPAGELEAIRVTLYPQFSMIVVGVGRNTISLTARQRDETLKTITMVFEVKERLTNTEPDESGKYKHKGNGNGNDNTNGGENGKPQPPEAVHTANFEYDAYNMTLDIWFYVDGKEQPAHVFEIYKITGGEIICDGMGGRFSFVAGEEWEIILVHIETGRKTIISYPTS